MVKYSLVGCGRIAKNHVAAAQSCSDIQISALCDCDKDKAEQLSFRFGVNSAKIYTDYHEMLEKERPELVAIATDSGSHFQIALDAINHGCNVIIEKPVTLSVEDADKLIAAAVRNKVIGTVCHQNRFNPAVVRLREALEEGRLGKLLYGTATVRWHRGQDYYDQAKWRGKWDTDGGALMNQCIHNIDLLRWMLGAPAEVTAVTARQNHDIEAEDFGAALVSFGGGAFGIIEGTTNVYPSNLEETLCIFGTEGTVKLGGSSLNLLEEWRLKSYDGDVELLKAQCNLRPPDVYGYGHTDLYKNMLSAVQNGHNPLITLEEGKAALELVLGIYLSSARGLPVPFPVKDCSSQQFTSRFL